MAERAY